MSRGRDRLEASSTLCHAHHLCVHVVTDTPPRDRYLLHSLGPVCLFGRTPSCGVVIRVSDLVHSVTPPPIHVFFMLHRPRVVERTTLKVRSDAQSFPTHCASWRSWHLFTFMARIGLSSAPVLSEDVSPPCRPVTWSGQHTARFLIARHGDHVCASGAVLLNNPFPQPRTLLL